MPSRVLTKQFRKAQIRTRSTILLATFLILSVGSVSAWQTVRLSGDAASVVQSYDAIQSVAELREALLLAETGHRGFLLTDQDSYLLDYYAGVDALPQLTARLHENLTPFVEAGRQAKLEAKLGEKLHEMAEVLELYADGRRTEALEAVEASTGKYVMDDLEELLELVRTGEEARLASRSAEFRKTRNLALLTVVLAGGFAVLASIVLLRGQRAASDRLLAAVDIIQGQKGYLEAMLSSMTSPLILMDREGIIRFVNAASVELFDHEQEDLIGQPLASYLQFRGSSERTGEESIFQRALAEHRVVRERRVGILTPSGPHVVGLTVRPVEADNTSLGFMITLHDIDEEKATVEELHQQDRVRDLEAMLGRIVAETASARSLLERCCEAIRQSTDAESVQAWLGNAADPNATLLPLRRPADGPAFGAHASALVNDAWRRDTPLENTRTSPLCFAFPLTSDPAPLGVIELRTRAPLHPRLLAELPRLATETALGYDRRRKGEKIARMATEKDRFIATLSHELRGPLVPLKYAVEKIGEEAEASPKLIGLLTRQVIQLERLVEDLLDAQRLQRGTLSLRLASLDMRAVIEQSVEAIAPLLEGKRQRLEIELDKEPLPVFGDQARLVQILFNLLNNASRYSSAGALIHLRAMKWGRQVEVSVSDHGIGIAEENIERVFHMFEQGSTGGNTEGLGIGLALVRQLVVLHGGKVVVSSPGVGSGATFGIQLPLARMPATTEPASGTMKRGSQPDSERGERPSAAELRAALFDRCVVVDDDVDTAETLALMLQSWGLTANVAHDAGEALAAVQRIKPELILLDLTLPGQERFALIQEVRRRVGPEVRVVAVTGHADDDIRREALAHGFDELLVKPISVEQLAAAASRRAVDLSSAQLN